MKKIIAITGIAVASLAVAAGSASAEKPECNWGELTREAAPLGEHSSSFDTPRLGLANVVNQGDLNATCELLR
jgi:hypothetical protein